MRSSRYAYIISIIFFITPLIGFSQLDTIVTNVEKIPCTIREVTTDAIKFSYPQEDLINTIYKNAIKKIILKSGRTQIFAESIPLKTIKSIDDFELVEITNLESDTKGLYRIGYVSSKAKGTTTLSNQERVKNRAYRKIKLLAAMMGANIVYISNQRNEGNKAGGYYQAGSSSETNLTGLAYSNNKLNLEDFKRLIANKSIYVGVEQSKLWSGDYDIRKEKILTKFNIGEIIDDGGVIEIKGELIYNPGQRVFKLVSMDKDYFNVFYEDKSSAYNVKIEFNLN
jgi:hypothetical protein